MPSPAERYAAFQRRQRQKATPWGKFREAQEFSLDPFQVSACEALDEGRDVLVAAPTGAGKTIVGEFAVALGLARGQKVFYTTPIKALSNQKFNDLRHVHGPNNVGLLTGDTVINGEAPIVVMTTEVLRNMLYNGSSTLTGLGYVVMDEVHYLADRFRGPVWEEVILHLAPQVKLVSLSATVSNAEEFGEWLSEVRGDTAVVVSEQRPVPLWQHMMVQRRILDLYSAHVDPTDPGTDPPISPDVKAAIRQAQQRVAKPGHGGRRGRGRPARSRYRTVRRPPRGLVIEQLDRGGLLPAIMFIFSRAGCEAAVDQSIAGGITLTTEAERQQIAEVVDARCADLPPEDLGVLDFWPWREALLAGVAAHHAGLLPLFKETVEHLFAAGLVKVVFATETLALGINMPARTVVLERLTKWDGRTHADITPGEYTQLTGRAGRRGIDVEGHAVVLYSSGIDPVAVAGLASRRTYPLRSSFHPTYNMAVNLIAGTGHTRAREILETSFAQFQADRSVVGLARRARSMTEAMDGYAEAMTCHLGDIGEYQRLRSEISAREKSLSKERSRAARAATEDLVAQLRPGDVLQIPHGRRAGFVVVLDEPDTRRLDGPLLQVLTTQARARRLGHADLPYGTSRWGHVRLTKKFNVRDVQQRRDLAASLRNALGAQSLETDAAKHPPTRGEDELTVLRERLRHHPCHGCADREEHLRWARRREKLAREQDKLLRRIEGRTSSIARDFDRVCAVLAELGYLTTTGDQAQVTEQGQWLRRLYSEKDLVVAECLRAGAWQDLEPAELAAVVSTLVFSSRTDDDAQAPAVPGGPEGRLALALTETRNTARRLAELERENGVEPAEPVDLGLVRIVHLWASGASLAHVLDTGELSAGDFVRWNRQVIDLLDQIAAAATTTAVRRTARDARGLIRRGIVAHDLA